MEMTLSKQEREGEMHKKQRGMHLLCKCWIPQGGSSTHFARKLELCLQVYNS